ncbi:MAG TPA: hypothetical protein VE467_16410 [Chryseolinea sp.]|nr:hypothetical protein [Chryseolinea sp.]
MKDFRRLISVLAMALLVSSNMNAQNLSGAWKLMNYNGKPFADEGIKIYSDGYFMFAIHSADGAFVKAGGGNYKMKGNEYIEVLDFNSSDSTQVREPSTYTFSLRNDELTISTKGKKNIEVWKKVDGTSSAVSGAWRFGARVNDEGVAGERRGGAFPRQTMKILSGNYFQWAAFNYETKQFSGTGGGTYKLQDNQYTETIRFFSRDNSRVGISLTFECKLIGTDWYHKGKGTTGNPVSEVWEKVK